MTIAVIIAYDEREQVISAKDYSGRRVKLAFADGRGFVSDVPNELPSLAASHTQRGCGALKKPAIGDSLVYNESGQWGYARRMVDAIESVNDTSFR